MATAPQSPSLPLFYNDLAPLNQQQHSTLRSRSTNKASWLAGQHAVPLTVEEFPMAQRHFPIVFTTGNDPVPLALMGLNEGVNVFVEADGTVTGQIYMPAYVRRYPFMLARMQPDSEELTLCFDPTSDLLGEFEEGVALFEGDNPSEACKGTLAFCEQFEVASQKTTNFIAELKKHELLMDGELTIHLDGMDQPFSYRGFQMVNEQKLRDMRGDILRSWNQNGMLPLIYAHLFSLELAREIFMQQVQQGKGPVGIQQPAEAQA